MVVACFVALAANAGTIYLVGSGTVNGQSLPGSPNGNCLAVNSDNNVYKFTVEGVSWMKISDTNASNWNDFNKNGFTVDNKGDFVIPASDLGKTFNLWYSNGSSEGTNNINPPSNDEYTYTLTVGDKGASNSTLVVTANSDVQIVYEIYLRGSFDTNWNALPEYKFSAVDAENYELTGVTLPKGTVFKIADASWGAINYGGAGNVNANTEYTLTYNGSDLTLNQDISNATFKFNLSTNVMYIYDPSADPDVPVLPDFSNTWVHVGGEFNGMDFYNDGVNPNAEGIASFSNLGIGAGTFKVHVWTPAAGDVYYIMDSASGDVYVPTDQWVQFVIDGYDIYDYVKDASADAVYDIQYDVVNNQIYITKVGGSDEPVTPPTPDLHETLYLMGDINDYAWNTESGVAATGVEGVYTWTEITVNNSNAGFGYFNIASILGPDWDTVNDGDRYGAPSSDLQISINSPAPVTLYAVNVSASGCQSWMIEAGQYDIVLDLNNMTLTAYEPGTTGVANIGVDATAPVYYNLQGVKVANPENGLYIKVVNGKATKTIVRK